MSQPIILVRLCWERAARTDPAACQGTSPACRGQGPTSPQEPGTGVFAALACGGIAKCGRVLETL